MIDRDTLHRAYANVTLARQLDDKVHHASRSGGVWIAWFPWHGTELVASAVGLALRPDDYLVTYYRDVAAQLAKGASLTLMTAEAFGRSGGGAKGKSGPLHTIDLEANVVMNSAVVGGQLPIAPGWALSSVLRGDGKVTVCTFGDGAVNEGAFHESMTLASLWKLPLVYLCYNNAYAEHTPFSATSPVEHVADRASAYGVPAVVVDGGDFLAVWEAINTAIERARSGQGPTLVEALVTRARGHHHFDSMPYVPKPEVEAIRAADPVPPFRSWLLEQDHATAAELDALDEQAATAILQAWEYAQDSPYPDVSELYTDVYATN
jgi:acetoin:2,6-dichlorophenolindophenol oxidoreductase subunit alpha